MTIVTPRLRMPLLDMGQAQKELTHNEALTLVDFFVQPRVEAMDATVPPADPSNGQAWIVGNGAQGIWAGHENSLALWTDGGWRFVQPFRALCVWIGGGDMFARWDGLNWTLGIWHVRSIMIDGMQIIGPREPPISDPSGGQVIDAEARSAIDEILVAMRNHGLIDS